LDVITCAEFLINRFKGIDFVGGGAKICQFPLELKVAVNTVQTVIIFVQTFKKLEAEVTVKARLSQEATRFCVSLEILLTLSHSRLIGFTSSSRACASSY